MTDDSYETTRDEQRKSLDALEQSIRDRPQGGVGNSGHSISSYPSNGGPPDISRIGELSARGIDKISIETADQIREIGEAAVTRAEALRVKPMLLLIVYWNKGVVSPTVLLRSPLLRRRWCRR